MDDAVIYARSFASYGNYTRATTFMTRALRHDPSNVDNLIERSKFWRELDLASNALLDARRAVLVAPDRPTSWESLAEAYVMLGSLDAALDAIDAAVPLVPIGSADASYTEKLAVRPTTGRGNDRGISGTATVSELLT